MILDLSQSDYDKAIHALIIKSGIFKEEYLKAISDHEQDYYLNLYNLSMKRIAFLKENLSMLEAIHESK